MRLFLSPAVILLLSCFLLCTKALEQEAKATSSEEKVRILNTDKDLLSGVDIKISESTEKVSSIEDSKINRILGGDYTLLNQILGQLQIELDTSTVGTVEFTYDVPVLGDRLFKINLEDTTLCQGLGVGDISIETSPGPNTVIDGVEYESQFLSLVANDLRFTCTVGLCVDGEGFGETCGGTVSVISDAGAESRVVFREQVLSTNFELAPPTIVRDAVPECSDKVSIDNVVFDGEDIFKIRFIFEIDLTGQVLGALNGDSKSLATEPIQDALCEQLANFTVSIRNLIVNNPFTNNTDFDINPDETIGDAALVAENLIKNTAPENVDLISLFNNTLVNLLFPDAISGRTLVITPDNPLISTLLGFLNVTNLQEGVNPLYYVIDSFVQDLNLVENNGAVTDFDVIGAIDDFFPGFLSPGLLSLNLTLDGVGDVAGELNSLLLSITPTNTSPNGSFNFSFIGEQTVVLPQVALGDISVKAGLQLDLNVSTTMLFEQLIEFQLSEAFEVTLGWSEFLFQSAVMLAIDGSRIPSIEIGPAIKFIFDCVLSLFYQTPRATAALFNADSIDLNISGFVDGIFNLVQDFINALAPFYQGVVPGFIEGLARDLVVNQEIIAPVECPTTPDNFETSLPYNFSQIFSFVPDFVNKDNIAELLESVLADFDAKPDGSVQVFNRIDDPIDLFTLELPSQIGTRRNTLEISISSATALGVLPPHVEELRLLDVPKESEYYPQGIENEIQIGNQMKPVGVSVGIGVTLGKGKGSVQEPSADDEEDDDDRRLLMENDEEINQFNLTVSLESLQLLIDIFASFSVYDVEATQLGKLAQFNCWISKLAPFGGLKQFLLAIDGFSIGLDCLECQTAQIEDLANTLAQANSGGEITQLLSEALDLAQEYAVLAFTEEYWNATITDAIERCENDDYGLGIFVDITADDLDELTTQDLTSAWAFVGAFFSIIGLAGFCTFGCRFGDRRRRTAGSIPVDLDNNSLPAEKLERASQAYSTDSSLENENKMLENTPLFKHGSVPLVVRVLVPLVIVLNLILFVFGHVDVIIKTDIIGQIAGAPFQLDDFAELSVVKTTKELWDGEAYFLAILLAGFSVVWPYIKLLGVAICWFFPTSVLSFQRRGSIITILDQLGKWSLVELYFVAFVLVILKIEILSPSDIAALPPGLYRLIIEIEPQFQLYTFTSALLLSLAISNVVMAYQDRIEFKILENQRKEQNMTESDSEHIGLTNFLVESTKKRRRGGVRKYRVGLSRCGGVFVVLGVLFSVALILFASSLSVLRLDFFGLARTAMVFSKQPTTILIDLYTFIGDSFSDATIGVYFFGTVFVSTVLIIPIIQLLSLMVIPFKKFTLKQALRFYEINKILSAWSATEVFVLAIGVTSLELRTVSRFIVEEDCVFLGPIMNDFLLPLGIVTPEDVDATCLGLEATVQNGAYVFFAALAVSNFAHLFIIKLFESYIRSRSHSHTHLEQPKHLEIQEHAPASLPVGIRFLSACRLVTIEKDSGSEQVEGEIAVVVPQES